MDADRQVVEFDEYRCEVWVLVRFNIYANDMSDAIKKFDSLFEKNEKGWSALNPDNFKDIESIERTCYVHNGARQFIIKAYFSTYLTVYGEEDDYDPDEAYDQLDTESLTGDYPGFVCDIEKIGSEEVDREYVDSGYRD